MQCELLVVIDRTDWISARLLLLSQGGGGVLKCMHLLALKIELK